MSPEPLPIEDLPLSRDPEFFGEPARIELLVRPRARSLYAGEVSNARGMWAALIPGPVSWDEISDHRLSMAEEEVLAHMAGAVLFRDTGGHCSLEIYADPDELSLAWEEVQWIISMPVDPLPTAHIRRCFPEPWVAARIVWPRWGWAGLSRGPIPRGPHRWLPLGSGLCPPHGRPGVIVLDPRNAEPRMIIPKTDDELRRTWRMVAGSLRSFPSGMNPCPHP